MSSPAKLSKVKKNSASKVQWAGALEGLHQGLLYGWALDISQTDRRVVLELCLNGEVIGSLSADVARTDLHQQFSTLAERTVSDPCHGFVADLGIYSHQMQSGILTVRVANSNFFLTGQIDRSAPLLPPVAAMSSVFSDGGLRLHGWAIDPKNPSRHLTIRAYLEHQQLAQCVASERHPSVRSTDIGSHGFNLNLPLHLADGVTRQIRVVDEQGVALNGSPVTVSCYASGAKALLKPEQEGLITEMIEGYERYLPRSIGMQHYREWSAQFESNPANTAASREIQHNVANQTQALCRLGFVLWGGTTADLTITRNNLKKLQGAQLQIFSKTASSKKTLRQLLQSALDAECDFIAILRGGDTLSEQAIPYLLEGFSLPGVQLAYCDSEHQGVPWFKPAWNAEYALASDFPLDLMLVRSNLIQQVLADKNTTDNTDKSGKTNDSMNPASVAWSALAQLWHSGANSIAHIPRVLYHVGRALSLQEQDQRWSAAQAALTLLEPAANLSLQTSLPVSAEFQARRIHRPLPASRPSVSLLIPTRDKLELLEACISSLQKYTDWPELEIIIIDNGSSEAKTLKYFKKISAEGVRVLSAPGPFNFSELNNQGVHAASGEIIGMINNDIEALHSGWLDEIISQLMAPGVGVVGAKLLWPNGMVQHGGVVLGIGNVAAHYGNRLDDKDWGDHGRNQLLQQVSAVTAACLFIRKSDFLAVGGMDTNAFPVAFNDVDLCLKIRASGKTILWTPYARLLHAESASRGHEDTPQKQARASREVMQFRQRWGNILLSDPSYHPSLNLDAHSHAFSGLALPPRNRAPRLCKLQE